MVQVYKYGTDKEGASCYQIRPILQGIDPLFDIEFNYDVEEYIVYFNGYRLMNVAWNDFDRKTIEKIEDVYFINVYGDIVEEVDKHNEKVQKSKEREKQDFLYEFTKDLRNAILKDI